jgi:hypothetical protein
MTKLHFRKLPLPQSQIFGQRREQAFGERFLSFPYILDVKWISRGVAAGMREMNPLSCE